MIDFGSYLIGAVLIFLIQAPKVISKDKHIIEPFLFIKTELAAFWGEWIGGLHLVRQKRPLSFAFITVGIALIGDSILGVLLVVFVQDIVGGGAQEFGWILTARGIGGVLGGLVIARIGSRAPAQEPDGLWIAGHRSFVNHNAPDPGFFGNPDYLLSP